jgi:hypothetical protein
MVVAVKVVSVAVVTVAVVRVVIVPVRVDVVDVCVVALVCVVVVENLCSGVHTPQATGHSWYLYLLLFVHSPGDKHEMMS